MNLLELEGVAISRGATPIVSNVSFAAARGSVLALMGPSGSGKTTLLRAIAGLEPVDAGRITVDGRIGLVFQFHHLFAHLPAHHNVWLAPVHVLGQPRAEAERRARELLEHLGVGHRADALPDALSGGEAQRVAIARALATDPAILLMDEPTASLDPRRRADLATTLHGLATEGRAVIVATHDVEFAHACADQILVVENGRVAPQSQDR
jgi:ABC-type polar amino acid transport system ATPase subunit